MQLPREMQKENNHLTADLSTDDNKPIRVTIILQMITLIVALRFKMQTRCYVMDEESRFHVVV